MICQAVGCDATAGMRVIVDCEHGLLEVAVCGDHLEQIRHPAIRVSLDGVCDHPAGAVAGRIVPSRPSARVAVG